MHALYARLQLLLIFLSIPQTFKYHLPLLKSLKLSSFKTKPYYSNYICNSGNKLINFIYACYVHDFMLVVLVVLKYIEHSLWPHLHLGCRDKSQLKTIEQGSYKVGTSWMGWLCGPTIVPWLVCMDYVSATFKDHLFSNVDVECVLQERKSFTFRMLPT